MYLKINKTKLIALMLLLCTVTLMFSSCLWTGGEVNRTIVFHTHDELVEFVEEYNSKNDGFVYTFISFDFDDHEDVNVYEHTFRAVWSLSSPFYKRDGRYRKMYDKDRSNGLPFDCKYIFHIDDIFAQVTCEYITQKDYNFYQSDIKSIELVQAYSFNELDNNDSKRFEIYGQYENFLEDFADLRSHNEETYEYEKYYSYMYIYQINIDNADDIRVKVCTESELDQEALDEICQLLLDNIVIINTEG